MSTHGTVLDRILVKKKEEVNLLRQTADERDLKLRAKEAAPPRDFLAALRDCPQVPIIAEIKKSSPSAGTLLAEVDVARRARDYEKGGAAALSVLTDGPFFGGSLDDLTMARQAVNLPVLRKDFIIDPLQLYESRLAGADAILLIVAALPPGLLTELFHQATDLGLTCLVEVHREEELAAALALKPPLIGINNRDLTTLKVSLETSLRLRPLIDAQALVVGESGLNTPADAARLLAGGLNAFLIGTALMKSPDPAGLLAEMCRAGEEHG